MNSIRRLHTSVDRSAWFPEGFDQATSLQFRRPFHTFLIKTASLCNLDCTYCYVYRGADQSWKTKPRYLEASVAQQIATRIREHVSNNALEDVSIVLHGGEPLLVGLSRLTEIVSVFEDTISCPIHWGMQTNGILLNSPVLTFLSRYRFRIGLSLDGTRDQNDRHRLYRSGHSSYDDILAALQLIQSNEDWASVLGGVLAVVDIRNDPATVIKCVSELGIRSMNIILPDAHHDSPPPAFGEEDLAYGKWLVEFFCSWFQDYPQIEIPYFEHIMAMMLGGQSTAEEIGAKSVDLIVIDTNGDIEAVDTLKVVGRWATSLGLNVANNSFDEALDHPAIKSRMSGFHSLCETCRHCVHVDHCGGGYLPHRYSHAKGFMNPSVYCKDLQYLFLRMQAELESARLWGLDKTSS